MSAPTDPHDRWPHERPHGQCYQTVIDLAADRDAATLARDRARDVAVAFEQEVDHLRNGMAMLLKDHDCEAMPWHDGCVACDWETYLRHAQVAS